MENSGVGGFLRNRRFGSYFDASTGPNAAPPPPPRVVVDGLQKRAGADECYPDDDDDNDNDGWFPVLISWMRIVVCFVSMMLTTFIWAVIMVVLLPWPYQRIRQGNIYGHVTGKMLVSPNISWFLLMNILIS